MNEQQILDTGLFVKHYITSKEQVKVPTGLFVLPKYANLKEGFAICIETNVVHGKKQYIGKVDALRFPLTSKLQLESFLGFAWDELQDGQIKENSPLPTLAKVCDVVDDYWKVFEPVVRKLQKESFSNAGGESWWRSRYSDFLTKNNSIHKSHEEWLYRSQGFEVWNSLWSRYKNQMENVTDPGAL